jgi:hypothetical protein
MVSRCDHGTRVGSLRSDLISSFLRQKWAFAAGPEIFLMMNRVTRLGEFSTIVRWFYSDSNFENYKSSPNVLLLFSTEKAVCILTLTKNVLGYILGDFFHKLIWSPWWWRRKKSFRDDAKIGWSTFLIDFFNRHFWSTYLIDKLFQSPVRVSPPKCVS